MAQHSVVAARNKLYRSQSIYHTEFRLSFRRICYKLKYGTAKLTILTKKCTSGGNSGCAVLHSFLCKLCDLGVPYFHGELATNP